MSTELFGRCACGASLTVYHLQFFCPLNKQQRAYEEEDLRELWWSQFMEQRLDTAHVAVLGEN